MPAAPPGMVSVSVVPGTRGPVAWYCSTLGERTCQAPAMGGESVGSGLPGPRAVEKVTEIVEPAATLSPVGEKVATVKGAGGAAMEAAADIPRFRATRTRPPATRITTSAPTPMNHQTCPPVRGRTCSPAPIATEMLPGLLG